MKIKVYDVKCINDRFVLSCKFTETSKVETFVVSREVFASEVRTTLDLIGKTIEFDFNRLKVCTFKENDVDTFASYIQGFKVVSEEDFVSIVKKFYIADDIVKLVCTKDSVVIVLVTNIDNIRKYFDCYKIPDLKGKTIKFIGVDLKKSSGITPDGRLYKFEKFEVLNEVDNSGNLKDNPIYTKELEDILKLLNLTQVKI